MTKPRKTRGAYPHGKPGNRREVATIREPVDAQPSPCRISAGTIARKSGPASSSRSISSRSLRRFVGRGCESRAAHTSPCNMSFTSATGRGVPNTFRVDARSTKSKYRGSVCTCTRRSEPASEMLRLCGNASTSKRPRKSDSASAICSTAITKSRSRLTSGSTYAFTPCPPITQYRISLSSSRPTSESRKFDRSPVTVLQNVDARIPLSSSRFAILSI
jgi:hypothetical protein